MEVPSVVLSLITIGLGIPLGKCAARWMSDGSVQDGIATVALIGAIGANFLAIVS